MFGSTLSRPSESATPRAAATAPARAGLKLMIVGRRKPGTTLVEHRHHIRHVHGEQVLRYIAVEPEHAPRRYAQHQVFDGVYRATPVATDPFALNRDFVTQIWVDDLAALARSTQTAFYLEHLKGDEDNFVDQATVVFMPSRERELRVRAAPAPASVKLFCFIQKAATAEEAAFRQAWTDAAANLSASPADAAIGRHVQNDVLMRPGVPATVDGIDEFWVDDEAGAQALLVQWQAALEHAMFEPGLATREGFFALMATEAVLHAGAA